MEPSGISLQIKRTDTGGGRFQTSCMETLSGQVRDESISLLRPTNGQATAPAPTRGQMLALNLIGCPFCPTAIETSTSDDPEFGFSDLSRHNF